MAALFLSATQTTGAPAIPNPSFEANAFANPPGFVSANTAITGWTASDGTRIGLSPTAGNEVFADNGLVPQGSRVAFIESSGLSNSTLSTTITGLVAGRHYRVQFRYNRRAGGPPPMDARYRVNGGAAVHLGNIIPVDSGGIHANPYHQATTFFVATGTAARLEIINNSSLSSALLVDDFRIVEATGIQVTNNSDSGAGSLRQALITSMSTPGFRVITFVPALSGATIALGGTLVTADPEGVAIDAGTLPKGVTISGGGVGFALFQALGPVHFRGLVFTGGRGNGAAIFSDTNLMVQATRCTFFGNAGGVGGAIGMGAGTLALWQCTLTQNNASDGGAIFVNNNAVASIDHCTVSVNTAPTGAGGGVLNRGTFTMTNSIVSSNTASSGPDIATFGPQPNGRVIAFGNNVIQGTSSSFSGTFEGDLPAIGPALLTPLADNGGPTPTMAETRPSLSRNSSRGSTITTDQRGRAVLGVPDVGAYEMQRGTLVMNNPLIINENSGPAVRTISRTDGMEGSVSVKVATVAGTAGAADFTGIAGQVITFNDGVTTSDVSIPITADALIEPNEYFTIRLSTPTGGATLGTPSSTTVTILDTTAGAPPDTTPPAVPAILSPLAGATLKFDGSFPVIGTARDNKGVALVTVQVRDLGNGTSATSVVGISPPLATAGSWSTTLGGAFTSSSVVIDAFAQDAAGNTSGTVTRTVNLLHPLRVDIVGGGTVTAGFAPRSYRKVGVYHTITATPRAGQLFTGWTLVNATPSQLGITNVAIERPTLNFIHRAGLELIANFVPSPYTNLLTGGYNGLIQPGGGGGAYVPNLANQGLANLTASATGAFSGTLLLDGLVMSFSGVLDHTGQARFGSSRSSVLTIPRPLKPSMRLTMNMANSGGTLQPSINGSISVLNIQNEVEATLAFIANRDPFDGINTLPPSELLGPGLTTGFYTVIMPSVPTQPFHTETFEFPQGHGFARATLTRSGVLTFTDITLADGTKGVTTSTFLHSNLRSPLFIPLYNRKGYIHATLVFNAAGADTDFSGSASSWLRPEIPTSHYYPAGWHRSLTLRINGAKYVITPGASVLKVPGGGPLSAADADGNASVQFTSGQLLESITGQLNVSTSDVITKVPVNDPNFTLLLNRATGIYSGSFTHTDLTRPVFSGIIYQKGANAGGWGFFLTRQPVPIDYTGESGAVRVIGR